MTCEDFQLRLTAFSLGELEQGEVSDARDHVATCDNCASSLLLDRQLTALLRASAVPAPQETVTVVPAPDPGSPLSAAWSSYHARGEDGLGTPTQAQAERLFAVLGPDSRTPDLAAFGLTKDGWEARDLAGHLAAVAEYRDPDGGRVTLMRWRGDLPRVAKGTEGGELAAYTWGRHTSYWWEDDGLVWCLVGTIDQKRLYGIAEHLGGESSPAPAG
jgi:hypothetical protein